MTAAGEDSAPVRIGALGCSDIGLRRTFAAIGRTPGMVLNCIGSRDGSKAAEAARRFGSVAVTGYERLLERSDVDAVYISLPAILHAPWVERALEAGKHVLVEKPLTDSYSETEQLLGTAEGRALVLMENFMFLRHSQHARVEGMLADGTIGDVRSFSSAFTIPPKPPGDIRYSSETGGGALLDIGVYPVRAALRFLGPHLEIAGAVLRRDRERSVVLSGSVLLSTPSGVGAQLTFGMEQSYRTGYRIYGSSGELALDRAFTPPDTYLPTVRISRQDHREEFVLSADTPFENTLGEFRDAVLKNSTSSPDRDASLCLARLVDEIADRAEVRIVDREV